MPHPEANQEVVKDLKITIEDLIEALCDNPTETQIRISEGHVTVLFEVTANIGDTGKLIGPRGLIIDAIRTIMIASARRQRLGKRVAIEIMDNPRHRQSANHAD